MGVDYRQAFLNPEETSEFFISLLGDTISVEGTSRSERFGPMAAMHILNIHCWQARFAERGGHSVKGSKIGH